MNHPAVPILERALLLLLLPCALLLRKILRARKKPCC